MSRMMCCATPGPAPVATSAEDSFAARLHALRMELMETGLSALQRRAALEGVDSEDLAAAVDSEQPREAIAELILDFLSDRYQQQKAAVRKQLEELGLSALQRRALAEGLDDSAIECAIDSDNPREAVIDLLLDATVDTATFLPQTQPPPGDGENMLRAQTAALQQELATLRVMALYQRAIDSGVDVDHANAAMDSCDAREKLIDLIHASNLVFRRKRRNELLQLPVMTLHKEAEDAGIASDILDDTMDRRDRKERLVDLLLPYQSRQKAGPGSTRLHRAVSRAVLTQESGQDRDEGQTEAASRSSVTKTTFAALHSKHIDGGFPALLRTELEGLETVVLQRRAEDCSIPSSKIENAMDCDEPKSALIELILQYHSTKHARGKTKHQYRQELLQLRVAALQERALCDGVDRTAVEDALDSSSPKDVLVALLLANEDGFRTLSPTRS